MGTEYMISRHHVVGMGSRVLLSYATAFLNKLNFHFTLYFIISIKIHLSIIKCF